MGLSLEGVKGMRDKLVVLSLQEVEVFVDLLVLLKVVKRPWD